MKKTNNLILSIFTVVFLVGCGENKTLSSTEVKVSEQWIVTYITADIVLILSESIQKKYLNNDFFKLTKELDNSVIESIISIDDNIVTVTPKNPLVYSYPYVFTISSEIKDFFGNSFFDNNLKINFSIENGYIVKDRIEEPKLIKKFIIVKK